MLEQNKELKMHNDKHNLNYNLFITGYGLNIDFIYDGIKRTAFITHSLKDEIEYINESIDRMINYLKINREEKDADKFIEEINSNKYILLEVSDKEECLYYDISSNDKELESSLEIYENNGLISTYFIIRSNLKNIDLTYEPFFYNVAFESFSNEEYDVYIKNKGENCIFITSHIGKMLLRPEEQLQYCEKNLYKNEVHLPYFVGK